MNGLPVLLLADSIIGIRLRRVKEFTHTYKDTPALNATQLAYRSGGGDIP